MKDKPADITGGTTGFGKGTAELLVSKDVKVVICGRRNELGEQAVAEIRAKGGSVMFNFTNVNDKK